LSRKGAIEGKRTKMKHAEEMSGVLILFFAKCAT
jgi:hypothetical protein